MTRERHYNLSSFGENRAGASRQYLSTFQLFVRHSPRQEREGDCQSPLNVSRKTLKLVSLAPLTMTLSRERIEYGFVLILEKTR
jgi:hypothetical protein